MKRREFMVKSALSAIAVSKLKSSVPGFLYKSAAPGEESGEEQDLSSYLSTWAKEDPANERLNADYISFLPGVEYFMVGNGEIQGIVQYCKDNKAAPGSSFFGLTIMSAEHFTQKWTTFLYNAGRGFGNTTAWLGVDGNFYGINEKNFKSIGWKYIEGVPVVSIVWSEHNCEMEEQIHVPSDSPVIFRRLRIKNLDAASHDIGAGLSLVPNIALFDDVYTDEKARTANAEGFTTLRMFSYEKNIETLGRYTVRAKRGTVMPGGETEALFAYYLKGGESLLTKKDAAAAWSRTVAYWEKTVSVSTGHANLDKVWNLSKSGLKAHVANSGKRDSGIWEYGMEWVRDDVMVMTAFLQSGLFKEAKVLLDRMFTKFVTNDGRTFESSQVFPFQFTELDQNGELLYGAWAYICWTGDYATVKKYWDKIVPLAELPLRPLFWQKDSNLLSNTREYWERSDSFGVKPGYELTYEFWVILGLEKAAEVAARLGHHSYAAKWSAASRKMKNSFLKNPKYRLIEDGHFIKRRTLDGEWQKTMIPPNRDNMPAGTPIAVEKTPLTEPDTSEVFPIIYGMVDPKSELALKTLEWVEPLWNQRWTIGGYERYNSSSEPEPPGPWPVASTLVAEAYLEAGNFEKAMRVIDWLTDINGGMSGGWFEYYPEGHPTVGLVGWNWAENIHFVVEHMLGLRPELDKLTIRPRLGGSIDAIKSQAIVRGMRLNLNFTRSGEEDSARVNNKSVPMNDGQIVLPYKEGASLSIEMKLKK